MIKAFSSFGCRRNLSRLLPLILIAILLLRLFTLEVGDLLDPTETRYATIAKNMLTTGDWVAPKLPSEEGLEVYLSKPPLHFWLTAISYSLFGIDEWSSRLPSLLGLLIIVVCLLSFSKQFLTRETGYLSSIICITSPLMFFLGGSSTVDVTFTAFTTAALVSFAFFAFESPHSYKAGLLLFLFSALAFLTKGPAGLVIIGLPILVISLYRKDFRCLWRLPWILGTVIFVSTVVPWFYFLEKSTPGATSYFFITENFLRFTTKDYGGRHGAAHIRPYGSIWWMAALSILPWLIYLSFGFRRHVGALWAERKNHLFIFILSMALSPLVFFTFAKSILPAYSTPAIPGISLLFAYLILKNREVSPHPAKSTPNHPHSPIQLAVTFACGLTAIMLGGLIIAAPLIEPSRSAENLLKVVASRTKAQRPIIGTVSDRDLSPYWIEGAYEEELSKPIRVVHASVKDIETGKFRNLIIRDKRLSGDAIAILKAKYEKRSTQGRWHWYRRRNQHGKDVLAYNTEVSIDEVTLFR